LEVKRCPEGFSVIVKGLNPFTQENMMGKLNGALGFHEATVEGNGSWFLERQGVCNSDVPPAHRRCSLQAEAVCPWPEGQKPVSFTGSHWFCLHYKE